MQQTTTPLKGSAGSMQNCSSSGDGDEAMVRLGAESAGGGRHVPAKAKGSRRGFFERGKVSAALQGPRCKMRDASSHEGSRRLAITSCFIGGGVWVTLWRDAHCGRHGRWWQLRRAAFGCSESPTRLEGTKLWSPLGQNTVRGASNSTIRSQAIPAARNCWQIETAEEFRCSTTLLFISLDAAHAKQALPTHPPARIRGASGRPMTCTASRRAWGL